MEKKLKITGYDKNPALRRISEMLENSFNEIGEKIRTDLIRAYEGYAKRRFKEFIATVPTRSGEIKKNQYSGGWEFDDYSEWSVYKGGSRSPFRTWENIQKVLHHYELTLKPAREKADMAYENSRDSFVYKNLDKISRVLGNRSDLKNAVIKFEWKVNCFKGNLQVYLEGAYFRGDLDVKYVVRTIPRVTPYFQYPLLFTEAEIGGKLYRSPSEEELRILLGATKSAAEEKREAAVAAGVCPMSGQPVPAELLKGLYNRMAVYVRCPTCKAIASVNKQSWKFRSHKTPGAERAGAAQKLETAGYCPMSRAKVPAEIVAAMGPVEPYKDPKGFCPSCKQQVRLDAERDWIFTSDTDRATQMTVKSAKYYKHKLTK